jgi:hypothetical protein
VSGQESGLSYEAVKRILQIRHFIFVITSAPGGRPFSNLLIRLCENLAPLPSKKNSTSAFDRWRICLRGEGSNNHFFEVGNGHF